MDEAKLYWTIIVCIISGGWVVTMFYRDRILQALERGRTVMEQLQEGNRLMFENPDILRYLSKTAQVGEEFFRNPAVLEDEIFFKAKTMVYEQLNSFDEILSASSVSRQCWGFLKPPALIEISDWESYIKTKLRHPLYRSILIREGEIFGESVRRFWNQHRTAIEATPADPFVW